MKGQKGKPKGKGKPKPKPKPKAQKKGKPMVKEAEKPEVQGPEKPEEAEELSSASICPGCGKGFSESDWAHPHPVAEWPVVDGLTFHGYGCIKSYQEKLAAMSRVLSSEVAK